MTVTNADTATIRDTNSLTVGSANVQSSFIATAGTELKIAGSTTSQGSVTLNGDDVTVESAVSGATGITLNADDDVTTTAASSLTTTTGVVTVTADADSNSDGTITLAGPIDHGSGGTVVSFADADGSISGAISGVGNFTKNGAGTLNLAGTNDYTGSTQFSTTLIISGSTTSQTTVANTTTLDVRGSMTGNTTLESGGTLIGTGSTSGSVTADSGSNWHVGGIEVVGPFASGTIDLNSGSTFHIDVDPDSPGSSEPIFDTLTVTGAVDVTGATMSLDLNHVNGGANPTGWVPKPGNVITIIDNDGDDPIVGTFVGYPNPYIFTLEGITSVLTYEGGDGNDLQLIVGAFDYGDAPTSADSGFDSSYPVTLAQNGARNIFLGPMLGALRDFEPDGEANADATKDDITDDADEDGIAFPATIVASQNNSTQSSIVATLGESRHFNYFNAFFDFNRDGDWDDEGEHVLDDVQLSLGANLLTFTVPQGTSAGTSYARFRVSDTPNLGVRGLAVTGEVEDYQVTLAAASASLEAVVNVPVNTNEIEVFGDEDDIIVRRESDGTVLFRSNSADIGLLTVNGTADDETFTIQALTANTAVYAGDGHDMFNVQPSIGGSLTVHGGDPTFGDDGVPPAGDKLDFDPLGNTFRIVGKTIYTNGGTPTDYQGVTFAALEEMTFKPLGTTTAFYDFNKDYLSRLQPGYTAVLPTQEFSEGSFGWVSATPNEFNEINGFGYGMNSPFGAILGDGHASQDARTFRATVANGFYLVGVKLGDRHTATENVRVTNGDNGFVLLDGIDTNVNSFVQDTFVMQVKDGTLDLIFSDTDPRDETDGVDDYRWAVNAIEIRPAVTLTMGLPTQAALSADGILVDRLTAIGATPGTYVTVHVTAGTIISQDALDEIEGIQILADAVGNVTFDVRRPFVAATSFVKFTDVNGGETGCSVVTYTQPPFRRFDFNKTPNAIHTQNPAASISVPDGFIGVQPDDVFSATTGYGWDQPSGHGPVEGGQVLSAPPIVPFGGVQNDYHTYHRSRTFTATMPNGTFRVTLMVGIFDENSQTFNSFRISAEDGAVVRHTGKRSGDFELIEFDVTISDGNLSLQFGQDRLGETSEWIVNGLWIRETSSVDAITLTPSLGTKPADGLTTDVIQATSSLLAGVLVTVDSTLGTITSTDVDDTILGTQVMVGQGGAIRFDLLRPSLAGVPTITLTAVDGAAQGTVSNPAFLNYVLPRPVIAPRGTLAGSQTTTDLRPTLDWTALGDIDRFEVWVNDLTRRQSRVIRDVHLTDPTFTPQADLQGGMYRAWVRSYDENGSRSDWSERFDFEVIDTSQPLGPVEILGPLGSLSDTTPTFVWSKEWNTESYVVWVNNLSTGTAAVIKARTADTSFTPDEELPEGQYRLWIKATNRSSAVWSEAAHFVVTSNVTAPGKTQPIGPHGAIDDHTPTISWKPVNEAARYFLWVNDLDTGKPVLKQRLSSTSFTPTTELPAGTYQYWIKSENEAGGTWSPDGIFHVTDTVTRPIATTLLGPSSWVNAIPTFRWERVTQASRYFLWVDNLTTGESGVLKMREPATSFTPADELPAGKYRFWVKTENSAGGVWSQASDFEVYDRAPSRPTITAPRGAITSRTPTIEWEAQRAESYFLWIDRTSTGETGVVKIRTSETSYTPSTQLEAGTYRFWVKAENELGHQWSYATDFVVADTISAPSAPVLFDAVKKDGGRIVLSWSTVPESTRYFLWINDKKTNNPVFKWRDYSTSVTLTLPQGDYRYWVKAENSAGGSWSIAKELTVE